jgi:hypothetical protein
MIDGGAKSETGSIGAGSDVGVDSVEEFQVVYLSCLLQVNQFLDEVRAIGSGVATCSQVAVDEGIDIFERTARAQQMIELSYPRMQLNDKLMREL